MTPRQVASAVCRVMGGSTPEAILAPQRGTPRTALLRAISMWVWQMRQDPAPSYTAIGRAFGRDRRNVARGYARLDFSRQMQGDQLAKILELTRG